MLMSSARTSLELLSSFSQVVPLKRPIFFGTVYCSHDAQVVCVCYRLMVERLFNICLVPYTLPPHERMKRLYRLYGMLDEPAVKYAAVLSHRNSSYLNSHLSYENIDLSYEKKSVLTF